MKEIFKDIPGFEGFYQVSNYGKVKSLNRKRNGVGFNVGEIKERILKPGLGGHGYYSVQLYKKSSSRSYKISVLVAMTFLNHNPFKSNLIVDHINNIKTDDRVINLQLISKRLNNSKDKNSETKHTGVYKSLKKFRARAKVNNKMINIGTFESKELASEAYQNFIRNLNE